MQAQVSCTNRLQVARSFCDRFYCDESGQDLIEYALLAAMVGLTSVSGTKNMAAGVANGFTHISTAVANAIPGSQGGGNGSGNNGNKNNGGGRRGRHGGFGGGQGGRHGG